MNDIHRAEFDNGLTLLVREDTTSPVVSIQMWCEVGGIFENEFLGCGLSHLLEHMAFKGTSRRSGKEIAHTLQQLGGYINAYTSYDRTVYYTNLPSDGWAEALDVLTDAVFHSTFPEEEFEKEKEVIRREFAMGKDDPSRELQKLLFHTAFAVHPYRHPVIGYLDRFNIVTHTDLVRFYRRHYIPERVTCIVVGNVKAQEVEEALKKMSGDIPRQAPELPYIPAEPPQFARRIGTKPFPTDTTRLFMAYHIPPVSHPDVYALDLLASMAGDGKSSRLHQKLVEEKKLLHSVHAFSYTPAQSGLWGVAAVLSPHQTTSLSEVEEEVQAVLDSFKDKPVSLEELTKARRQAQVSQANERKTVSGQAAAIGMGWMLMRDPHMSERYIEALEDVTVEDIQRVAHLYLAPSRISVAALYPQEQATQFLSQKISSNSFKRTLEHHRLESGIPYVFVSDNKIPLITARVTLKGGLLAETPTINGLHTLLARTLDKGTATRTAAQLATEIENLGATLQIESGLHSLSIAIEGMKQDLSRLLELLEDVVFHPVFPEEEIAKEQQKIVTDLKLENDEPLIIARNALRKNLFGKHPYGMNRLGTPENVVKLNQPDLKIWYKRLIQPANITIAMSGDFDASIATTWIKKTFDTLDHSHALPVPEPPVFPTEAKSITVTTEKEQAILQIGFPGASFADPNRAALEIAEQALSDLGSRLFLRIREKHSLAYFVGSTQFVGEQPGCFSFYLGTDPARLNLAQNELLDEIGLLARNGLEAEEFERARTKLLGQRLLQEQHASWVAHQTSWNILCGLGADFEETLQNRIRMITLEEINKTLAKWFSTSHFVSITICPGIKSETV